MAFKRFFRNSSIDETSFFDEGPRIPETKFSTVSGTFSNSSSIETVEIDAYRQGVEITQQKHFDAGVVKIHAGEPGHALSRNRYGMDRNFRPDTFFEELDYFDPVFFLKAQELASPLLLNIITFPIITGDNDQIENYVLDGIIEPFPIREVISFFSIEVPFISRTIRASMVDGNEDTTFASDRVLTVDEFDPSRQQTPYLDLIDLFNGKHPLNGYFPHEKTSLPPFVDKRLVRNVEESLDTTQIQAALSIMTGSTDNYVTYQERSSTSGWVYDNSTSPGTDSIAFGGKLY